MWNLLCFSYIYLYILVLLQSAAGGVCSATIYITPYALYFWHVCSKFLIVTTDHKTTKLTWKLLNNCQIFFYQNKYLCSDGRLFSNYTKEQLAVHSGFLDLYLPNLLDTIFFFSFLWWLYLCLWFINPILLLWCNQNVKFYRILWRLKCLFEWIMLQSYETKRLCLMVHFSCLSAFLEYAWNFYSLYLFN